MTTSEPELNLREMVKDPEQALLGTGESDLHDQQLAAEVLAAGSDDLTAMIIALRRSHVGAFQRLAGDLRSLEAATQAAMMLKARFEAVGLEITLKKPTE